MPLLNYHQSRLVIYYEFLWIIIRKRLLTSFVSLYVSRLIFFRNLLSLLLSVHILSAISAGHGKLSAENFSVTQASGFGQFTEFPAVLWYHWLYHLSPKVLFWNTWQVDKENLWELANPSSSTHQPTTILRPFYRSTCFSQRPQLRTGGFCWCKLFICLPHSVTRIVKSYGWISVIFG